MEESLDEERVKMVLRDVGEQLETQVLSDETLYNILYKEYGNAIRKFNLNYKEIIRLKELIFDEYKVNL